MARPAVTTGRVFALASTDEGDNHLADLAVAGMAATLVNESVVLVPAEGGSVAKAFELH